MTQGAVGPPMADEAIALAKTACCKSMQRPPGTTVVQGGCSSMTLQTGCRLMADTARGWVETRDCSVGPDPKDGGVAARRPREMAM